MDTVQKRLRQYAARYAQAKQPLQELGFIALGTVQTRYKTCGQPLCACRRDPDRRHGPYYHWTRKIEGKTVSVTLTKEQAELYREAIDNARTLNRTMRAMRRISSQALSAAGRRRKTS